MVNSWYFIFQNQRISNFQGHVILTLTLDWVIDIPSYISHRPQPTYQILLRSEQKI